MRKNLYALAIAGILAVSTMAPTMVSAAGTPTTQTHETPVSYKYKDPSLTFDGFTVTVPAALDITSEKDTVVDKVIVKMEQGRNIDTGKAIKVEVKSKNEYKLTKNNGQADGTNDPTYELKAKKEGAQSWGTAFSGAAYQEVAQFVSTDFTTTNGAAEKYAELQAKITKKPALVGTDLQTYNDTLTFQVSVGNAGA